MFSLSEYYSEYRLTLICLMKRKEKKTILPISNQVFSISDQNFSYGIWLLQHAGQFCSCSCDPKHLECTRFKKIIVYLNSVELRMEENGNVHTILALLLSTYSKQYSEVICGCQPSVPITKIKCLPKSLFALQLDDFFSSKL